MLADFADLEAITMDVCYNNLFKMLIDKGLRKTEFAKEVGISANTLAKLSRNELVSMDVMVRICRRMNCTFDDVVEILPEAPLLKEVAAQK